ncbi:MAG: hypothetical protein HYY22_00465 [Thaumarchaeota archaeon]|nr:hypothetical protein [Nitrososphaerota archaeon]
MGRTVPSFRMALEDEIRSWKPFEKVLRGGDRCALQEMFNVARCNASASSSAVRLFRFEGLFMSVLLEHQLRLAEAGCRLEQSRLCEMREVGDEV